MQMYIHGKVHVYIHWHVYINVNIADFWELYNNWHSVWWTAMFWQNSLCCRHGRVHVSFQPLASPPHPDTLEYVLQAPDWMGFILSCICNPPKRISTLPHCWEFAASRDGCVDYVWISGMRTGGGGGLPEIRGCRYNPSNVCFEKKICLFASESVLSARTLPFCVPPALVLFLRTSCVLESTLTWALSVAEVHEYLNF